MRRSDIYFFGIIFLAIVYIFTCLIFQIEMSWFSTYWWVLLIPGAIVKTVFNNTKVGVWLNGKIK